MKKYLAFRKVDVPAEVNAWACYHETSGVVGIPTDFIIELTLDERAELLPTFLFIPIVSKEEIINEIKKAKQDAINKIAKRAQEAEKNKLKQAKRQASIEKKKKAEELEQLKLLQEKYGKLH